MTSRAWVLGRLALLPAILLLLNGCPPGQKASPVKAKCTKFGDSCEFLPGKLGSCVIRDGCTGDGCFVCQSQH